MSIFSKVSRSKLPSNVFKDLTYTNRFTARTGVLYPVHCEEIVPGDVFFGGHGAFIRTQPLVSPIYQNFNYSIRWFFVPNRIIWDNFEAFITDQEKGKKDLGANHPHPYLYTKDKLEHGTIYDFLGIPMNVNIEALADTQQIYGQGSPVNALPYRAYSMIWNEYFRDENTMDAVEFSTGDGADTTSYMLKRVSWRKDYFTSALPFAQRGEAVQLLGRVILANTDEKQLYVDSNGEPLHYPGTAVFGVNTDHTTSMNSHDASHDEAAWMDPNGTFEAGIEFSAIRRANAIQRFLERSAVSGNRYAELLLAHFGVRSADASLQRPQYLGGGTTPINISPVEQTSQTSETSPQGTLAGKGVGVGQMYFNKRHLFTEHGWLIGVAYIRPDADYVDGLSRHLVKNDRYDYFWPDFQNIGEQEILNREIFLSNSEVDDLGSFGYQSRYAEYKWHGNEVHGKFLTSEGASWVAPRRFGELPTLSEDFVECKPDLADNFAIDEKEYDPWMIDSINVVYARRPMYYFNRGTL